MKMRIDAKGKYYTQRVSTDELDVILLTHDGEIHGAIHVHPNRRLSDEIDSDRRFIPLTEVTIYRRDGSDFKTEFLAVNKDAIVWITPVQAIEEVGEEETSETD